MVGIPQVSARFGISISCFLTASRAWNWAVQIHAQAIVARAQGNDIAGIEIDLADGEGPSRSDLFRLIRQHLADCESLAQINFRWTEVVVGHILRRKKQLRKDQRGSSPGHPRMSQDQQQKQ